MAYFNETALVSEKLYFSGRISVIKIILAVERAPPEVRTNMREKLLWFIKKS